MNQAQIPPQLRWACRRGMLELDVLLGNFLAEKYVDLPLEEQDFFEKFLLNNDQDLFEWLTGKKIPDDIKTKNLVDQIRGHAKHRN